jgi:hypothetical protein
MMVLALSGRGIQDVVEHTSFYGRMVEDGRILSSYRADTAAFLIQQGPNSLISEAQHLLQRYLLHYRLQREGQTANHHASTATPSSFDEAALPLLSLPNDGR